jgi:hypothetical protein
MVQKGESTRKDDAMAFKVSDLMSESRMVEKNQVLDLINQGKKDKQAGAYRIQVSLSEENYMLLKALAGRAGTTMSAIASILIDAGLHSTQPLFVAVDMSSEEGRRRLQQVIEAERAERERRGIKP